MRRLITLVALLCASLSVGAATTNLLFNTSHAAATACLQAFSSSALGTTVFIDENSNQPFPAGFQNASGMVTESQNTSATYYSVGSGGVTVENVAPYQITSSSVSGDYPDSSDQQIYASEVQYGLLENWAQCCSAPGVVAPPPTAGTNVNYCSITSQSAPGAEFCLSANTAQVSGLCSPTTPCYQDPGNGTTYPGCITGAATGGSPSATTSSWSQILAYFKQLHPTWTWFDVKAAFRQTASNWSTGYTSGSFGYGSASYSNANAIASTGSLYLQPPGISLNCEPQFCGFYLGATLYPFRQTRRAYEVVYICATNYNWSAVTATKNEFTATDLTNGGCNTLVYSSQNSAATTPTFTYSAGASGSATFVAFTTDGSGHYSRVESFGPNVITFSVGSACLK